MTASPVQTGPGWPPIRESAQPALRQSHGQHSQSASASRRLSPRRDRYHSHDGRRGAQAVSGEHALSPAAAAWGLEIAMTVTLIGIVVPLIKNRPMLACALAAALISLATKGLPNRLGYLIGGLAGNAAGMLAEAIQSD